MRNLLVPLAALLALLAYSAPATAAVPLTEGQSAAMAAWGDCLITAAQRVDDHTSDAATIGAAVRAECESKLLALKGEVTKGMTAEAQTVIGAKMDTDAPGMAVSAVLYERKGAHTLTGHPAATAP